MIFFILHDCMTCDCDYVTGVILLLCVISHYTFLFFNVINLLHRALSYVKSTLSGKHILVVHFLLTANPNKAHLPWW